MREDVREKILLRIITLLEGVSGILNVYRDRGQIPEFDQEGDRGPNLPCAILLDGSEVLKGDYPRIQGGQTPPVMMTLRPQIFVILMPRPITNEEVGPELSMFRLLVVDTIREDLLLKFMLGDNGGVEYRGCDTDMQSGSTMEGQLQFHFTFTYQLNPP
jgi:hypothetical protein